MTEIEAMRASAVDHSLALSRQLAQIEALCDEADRDRPNALAAHVVYTSEVRAVLNGNK